MAPRYFRLRTVPGRIRALTAVVLLALTGLFSTAGVALWDARQALQAIGHDEGPTVVATGDVTLALSDMDAQVTNVLLTGREDGWLCVPEQRAQTGPPCEREHPRRYYDIRREDAQQAALQAARLAGSDPVRLRNVQSVLEGLQEYDQRVQVAMERGRQAEHGFGFLPEEVAGEYRAATTLMTEDLLPKAHNLTLDSAAFVDATYEKERFGVRSGRVEVAVFGLIVVAALLGLQVYLTVRFRRLVSPFLAVAALGTVALTVASALVLATEAEYLRAAKQGGFDPVLTLSRARAIGESLDTDRARYLLDPRNADRYDQTYLEKSQAILYIPGARNLVAYYTALDRRSGGAAGATGSGIYDGEKADGLADAGRLRPLDKLLDHYRQYQRKDRHVRELADRGQRGAAARAHMDPALPYLPHRSFREHDQELAAHISRHKYVVDSTVTDADRALRPWAWLLPGSVLVIAALVVAGVRPRLAEYR
jgi:hypothetical protein